ncbi:AAEL000329-PA [Aedes aegypti]|uniref:AAEL000329-PA n=1 Tax=Aedes aegypti TaxID=7159 RepID=Q17PH9_AEDAE|nr:AAEL000329-PA [Aedes aegypti]
MTYQVTEEDTGDEPADQLPVQQRATPRPSDNGNYQSNLALSSTTVFARSKSDLNLASGDTVSNSPTTSSGYVDPRALGYSSSTMVPLARPTNNRIRRAASILPPIPPRSSRDMDVMVHRRANSNSESNPYDFSKSIAESAMDISLLTANANQLRLLITYNQGSQTYMACITFIIMSLVLQMLVAVTMIIVSLMKQNLMDTTRQKLKIITSVGVAIITMINILVASLVVAEAPNSMATTAAGTIMMMETMPATFAAVSTTAMPLTTSTMGVSTNTISSTVETMLDGGLSTLASSLLANITGT